MLRLRWSCATRHLTFVDIIVSTVGWRLRMLLPIHTLDREMATARFVTDFGGAAVVNRYLASATVID
jgi:hypothetical protein